MEKSNKDKSHSKTHVPKEQHKSSFESLEKPKKSNRSHHKRKPDSERDKQKAEFERSGNELKRLLAQFGSKAKVADEIERDTTKLRGNIRELMTKAKEKEKSRLHNDNPKARLDATPHQHNQNETTTSSSTSLTSLLPIIWNHFMSFVTMILRPLQVLYQSYERLYCKPNWTLFLMVVLFFELSIIGLIWKIRQRQYYMHFEPYEAVVHGTFGVEPTFWYYLCTIFTSVKDFLGEMRHGGRSFGSPSYDGLVPI